MTAIMQKQMENQVETFHLEVYVGETNPDHNEATS